MGTESMNRRAFVRTMCYGGLATCVAPSVSFAQVSASRRLVFVLLRGGFDGLAAVVPYGDPDYRALRGTFAFNESELTPLDDTFGLAPGLSPLRPLWESNELAVVHAMAIPHRTRSHFDGQAVLETGLDREKAAQLDDVAVVVAATCASLIVRRHGGPRAIELEGRHREAQSSIRPGRMIPHQLVEVGPRLVRRGGTRHCDRDLAAGAPRAQGPRHGGRCAVKPRHKKLIAIAAGLAALGVAAALVLNAFQQNLVFFFTPTQVAANEAPQGRTFRIGGMVETGSVKRSGIEVRFVVTDTAKSIPVVYSGALPDLFREGKGVVAQGQLGADGVFRAREVLAKHDENYMPPEAAHAVEKAQKTLQTK